LIRDIFYQIKAKTTVTLFLGTSPSAFVRRPISTPPPQSIEMNDILTQLNQMDEDKKKLFVDLLKNFNK